jgi:hypothetical protein
MLLHLVIAGFEAEQSMKTHRIEPVIIRDIQGSRLKVAALGECSRFLEFPGDPEPHMPFMGTNCSFYLDKYLL